MTDILSLQKHGHSNEAFWEEGSNLETNPKKNAIENQNDNPLAVNEKKNPSKETPQKENPNNGALKHPNSDGKTGEHAQKMRIYTQMLASIGSGLSRFGVGGVAAITGVILPQLTDTHSHDIFLTKVQVSLFGSIVNIGNLLGALVSGPATTWIGQRQSLMVAATTGILSFLMMAFSDSPEVLEASRFFSGLSVGIVQCNSHNYVVELAHPSIRGRLIAMVDLLAHFGLAIPPLIGSFGLNWRNQAFLQIPAFLLSLIILAGIRDSPRWLILVNKPEAAFTSLRFFRGSYFNVQEEFTAILDQASHKSEKIGVITQLKLIKSRAILPIFLITSFLVFVIAWTGNIVFLAFSVDIIKSLDVSLDPYFAATIVNGVRILGGVAYFMVADSFNRKTVLCVPLFVASTSLSIFGSIFYVREFYDIPYIEWVHLTMLVVYSFFTSLYYPLLICFRGELLPNCVRSLGTGIHFCLLSLGVFFSVAAFPFVIDGLGHSWLYWIYSAVGFFLIIVITLFLPETKGKTLEEIETITTGELRRSRGSLRISKRVNS